MITAPTLTGPAGSAASSRSATGLWSGLPLPVLALQWLRDGAEIAGATAAVYVPVPGDDRCALELPGDRHQQRRQRRGRDRGAHGHLCRAERSGELFDEIFDQAPGSETVATAQVFTGENLGFAVIGARGRDRSGDRRR